MVKSVVRECLEARGESNYEDDLIGVDAGGEAAVRIGAESEGFTFKDALKRANLIEASDPETLIDSSGCPLVSIICTKMFSCFLR